MRKSRELSRFSALLWGTAEVFDWSLPGQKSALKSPVAAVWRTFCVPHGCGSSFVRILCVLGQISRKNEGLVRPGRVFLEKYNYFKPFQAIPRHFKPFQAISIHSKPFQGISSCFKLFQAISNHCKPFQAISKPVQAISFHFKSFQVIACHSEPLQVISSHDLK